jgi:serine/threonine protein kinase
MLHSTPFRGIGRSKPSIPGHAVGKLLGRGASADVYLVVSQQTGARLACKCIRKTSVSSAQGTNRLLSEILALKSLTHPNIVSLQSVLENDSYYFVLVEYCEGGTLEHQIHTKRSLSESLCREIFVQLMSGIAFCHSRQIAHRDLKPSNILVTTFPAVKIGDFGLAGLTGGAGLMSTLCGTIAFLAPEVFAGPYDALAADVWSAGIVLYSMLTGRIPWRCRNQQELIREAAAGPQDIPCVSAPCNDLLKKMINPDPAKRPKAGAVLEHPWMKGGSEVLHAQMPTALPPLTTIGRPQQTQEPTKRRKATGRLKLTFDIPSE